MHLVSRLQNSQMNRSFRMKESFTDVVSCRRPSTDSSGRPTNSSFSQPTSHLKKAVLRLGTSTSNCVKHQEHACRTRLERERVVVSLSLIVDSYQYVILNYFLSNWNVQAGREWL
jgi:hypothetical protein